MLVEGLQSFIDAYPRMRLKPSSAEGDTIVEGRVTLGHQDGSHPRVDETFKIRIKIPKCYPSAAPEIEEIGELIPRDGDYHVNPDGTLCLGSPFRIHMALSQRGCFYDFFQRAFIPYAYAVVLKLRHNIEFIYGELSHGSEGEIEDLTSLFGTHGKNSSLACLTALSQKKRIANKKPCPCGCAKRLGVCPLHLKLNDFRMLLPRCWFGSFKQRLDRQS